MMSGKAMPSSRIAWIDAWRALLIVLVVAGHAIGTASHYVPAGYVDFYEFVFKVIYSFHMPAFFMLAGLMTTEVEKELPIGFLIRKYFKRLLVPYFFFGLLGMVVYMVVMPYFGRFSSGSTGYYGEFSVGAWWHPWVSLLYGAAFPGTDGFRCNSVLWFLPCLFSVKLIGRLVLGFFDRMRMFYRIALILTVCIVGWAMQFAAIPSLPYGLSKLLWYFPFFLIGYLSRPVLICRSVDGVAVMEWLQRVAALIVFAAFAVLIWIVPNLAFRGNLLWYLVQVVLGVLGAFLSMHIAARISTMFSGVCFQLSVTSIGIMFLHKYFILAVMSISGVRALWARSALPVGFAISLVVMIASVAAAWVLSACARRFIPWTIGAQ